MLRKIKTIKNMAVFKDFNWDSSVINNKTGDVLEFKKINIIYGRNYSGKTTLSRILRAYETNNISDKYENPEFSLETDNCGTITQDQIETIDKTKFPVRVFNEDFVKDNLAFISDPESNIKSFAVLGGDKVVLQKEIDELKTQLGSNSEGAESGLYLDRKSKKELLDAFSGNEKELNTNLESLLKNKASGDRVNSIKYQFEKFGDQNYNVARLQSEINVVLDKNYTVLTVEERKKYEAKISETPKSPISVPNITFLDFKEIKNSVNDLLQSEVGSNEKILELAKNTILNQWVKSGFEIHKKNIEDRICKFCGNPIPSERWSALEKHFDEEYENLNKNISNKITELTTEIATKQKIEKISKDLFYSEFENKFVDIEKEFFNYISNYTEALKSLCDLLKQKQSNPFEKFDCTEISFTEDFSQIKTNFTNIVNENNLYTENLSNAKSEAQKILRLDEIYNFLSTINYSKLKAELDEAHNKVDSANTDFQQCESKIQELILKIEEKQSLLNDEGKGAEQVNKYLNHYFGNNFLLLVPIEIEDEITKKKSIYFEVQRNGKKAYNMSEGECSLIAFCYFIARLEDVDTKDKNPLIWIDDPISSLDSNHIFYVYSLLSCEIANKTHYEQLFISTHNLEFLKYLRRLNGKFYDAGNGRGDKIHLLVSRENDQSTISQMPYFLKENATEFNYLFREIYKCSKIENASDENYPSIYNFGNNARKFLEIYLFYCYPDDTEQRKKQEKFFGDGQIPVILSERIDNEFSHGNLERGTMPLDYTEIKKEACYILECIEKKDSAQYQSLLKSIGVEA